MKQKKEHDPVIFGKALSGLALRIIVAAYIVYIAWKIMSEALAGDGSIPEWGAILIFLLFAFVAVGFCVFALKQYKLALKSAEISDVAQPNYDDSGAPSEGAKGKGANDSKKF